MSCSKAVVSFILILTCTALTAVVLPAQDGAIAKPAKEQEGFRFRGGRADRGAEAFALLNCIQCHTVANVNVPAPKGKRRIDLTLGSEVRFVKRYEDLVLAITNPRHVINERYRAILTNAELQGEVEPLMPDLTDHMSVAQLLDLVAFLDQVYTAEQPTYGRPAKDQD